MNSFRRKRLIENASTANPLLHVSFSQAANPAKVRVYEERNEDGGKGRL